MMIFGRSDRWVHSIGSALCQFQNETTTEDSSKDHKHNVPVREHGRASQVVNHNVNGRR